MLDHAALSRLAERLGGLPVLGCLAGSSAAWAGVRRGDILLAVDGMPTSSWNDYIKARRGSRGWFVARIYRDGAVLELAIEARASSLTPIEMLADLVSQHHSELDETN